MPKRDRNAKRKQEELQKSAAKCQRLDTIFRRSLNDSLPEIPTMPPGNYDPSAAIIPDDTPKDKGVPPVIEILPSSCSRPSTSSSSSHDPFTAITSDDTPKHKRVPPVTEILPSSCSRPIASSSSSYDPSTAITPDHTLGDKDHHLTWSGNRQRNFPHTDVQRNSVNYCRCCQQIPRASLIFGKEMWPNKGSHICQEYEEMAKKSSKNGTIAIASGVRADCSDRLERVIDHMTSEPHIAATNKKKMDEAWEECTTSHPWLSALTAYNKTVFAMLLRMAVDVYNDCNRNGLRPIVADAVSGLFGVGPSVGRYATKWRRCGICSIHARV